MVSLLSPPLEAFFAVAKIRTVHGAAKELRLTQTGVTQRIRSLESSLSTTLFTRSRKGMRLTPEGEALFRYCLGAKELEGPALSQITRAGLSAPVRVTIVGPTSLIESRITQQCISVLKAFPQLNLSFKVIDTSAGIQDLKEGTAQLAVIPRRQVEKELDSKLLKPEKYVLVGCKNWKSRTLKTIVREEKNIDFDDSDLMTHTYLKNIHLLSEARSERHFVNNNFSLIEMLKEGVGYGVLTQEIAEPYLTKGQLILLHKGNGNQNELALVWYPRPEMPAYFKALIQAIQ